MDFGDSKQKSTGKPIGLHKLIDEFALSVNRPILAIASRRDRLLLSIEMTEALRPSELFALRWRSFDDQNTLKITETAYRGELRPYGKTPGSLTKVYLPDGLAAELSAWKVDERIAR
jgi:hypothetical protein